MAEVTGNDRRAVEDFARMPPTQQDEYLLRMPAHQRQEFITTVETVASDDEGGFLAGLIGPMMARIRAGERADKLSERAIRDSTSADTEYVRGINSSEYNYLSIPHEELQRYALQDNEPGQIGDVSAGYNDLMSGYERIHEAITKAVSTLHGSWEGEAASSATDFGDQLARYSERNTSNARLAAEVVARQSDASSSFKNSMPEPKPFSWDAQLAEARSADPISSMSILVEGFEDRKSVV